MDYTGSFWGLWEKTGKNLSRMQKYEGIVQKDIQEREGEGQKAKRGRGRQAEKAQVMLSCAHEEQGCRILTVLLQRGH